ncbi:S41 family peptidase [Chitinophaga sp.]|uniref:S41 family peptidase n=1 Tax=Chitinophaga sp. TaxID=1869181 RepID=UPI002F9441F5
MKAIAVLLLLLCNTVVYAQECDCRKKFDSVQVYLRKNYVGFIDKVTPVTQQTYTAMVAKLQLQAATIRSATHCLLLVNRYLRFFKDQHLALHIGYIPVTEKIALTQSQLDQLQKQPVTAVAGIYEADHLYKIALVKNLRGLRSYAAVILESTVPEWKPGEVIFELAGSGTDKFDLISYQQHQVNFDTVTISKQRDGLSALGWQRPGSTGRTAAREMPAFGEMPSAAFFFRQMNDSTGYLRIGSFDAANYYQTDSVLNANDEYIRKNTNLVIDIRDNGAGTDKLTERLRPLLYTQPVRIIGADFYATPDNIKSWSRLLDEQVGKVPDDYLEQLRNMIHQGDGLQGRLVSMGPDENMILPSPLPIPAKVAVIINGKCNNTAEQFLLEALQSKKVKVFGAPSAGALDYANVNVVKYSGPDFSIEYPVSRSRRVAMGQGIDNKGVQPEVKLDFSNPGWLEEVVKKL